MHIVQDFLVRLKNSFKKLSRSQKIAVIAILLLLLISILSQIIMKNRRTFTSRGAELPATPPTPPSNSYAKALYLKNSKNVNDTYVSAPAPIKLTNAYTLEAWVNIPKTATSESQLLLYDIVTISADKEAIGYSYLAKIQIAKIYGTNDLTASFNVRTNKLYPGQEVDESGLVTSINNGLVLKYDQWNHIAGTFVASDGVCKIKLYINGIDSGFPSEDANNCSTSPFVGNAILIGKTQQAAEGPYYLHGAVDEVKMVEKIKYSKDFIPSLNPGGVDEKTLFLYHMDGDLNDSSYSHYNGTLTGSNFEFIPSTIRTNNRHPIISTLNVTYAKKGQSVTRSFIARDSSYNSMISQIENLPPGLSITNCKDMIVTPKTGSKYMQHKCVIQGNPTKVGEFFTTFKVTDNQGATSEQNFRFIIRN
ncbi:hypothetical protein A3A93_04850 [Candidatus Roizmanbacteria bacterium RIFCSPLOWO2_01_FULL_38_12]|uniref:LamG-like jellyroll fold domain-containing protein n=1 Tax=Candidatus Roizmanbacteria bacterium RIFCSPLOWO2_01_FULL_38_12 TaxID=1802061 RepID=A0A1F7IVY8_9BACT|nr:MAG: hypothetical protein A3F59_06100 [Candidatus Roizmanbacteria bacterium RIFCSPHIGHO2_12_FULL_38_13]OGK47537.1 MAG: hypothetical protein A3A93_04850 [Candidatus Roizmanbacteria bacterium RIFCSPLOWO2_01_FULL_38_12]